jgi:hypothetical protein
VGDQLLGGSGGLGRRYARARARRRGVPATGIDGLQHRASLRGDGRQAAYDFFLVIARIAGERLQSGDPG